MHVKDVLYSMYGEIKKEIVVLFYIIALLTFN